MKLLNLVLLLVSLGEHWLLASDVKSSAWDKRHWTKLDLTYALFGDTAHQNQTRPEAVRRALREAFAEWQANSCFTFREVAASRADIKVIFTSDSGEQGSADPLSPAFSHRAFCHSRIKNVAGHAFFRNHDKFPAQIHVNNELFWLESSSPPGNISLRTILLHEIGHVLGLYHSTSKSSVMYKFVFTNEVKRVAKIDSYSLDKFYKGACERKRHSP